MEFVYGSLTLQTRFIHEEELLCKLRAAPAAAEALIILTKVGLFFSNTCLQRTTEVGYVTLCVSRNLLISLDIRSLLSSSISMALMSSWGDEEQ